jgi:uncharacterized protein YaeQ
MALKATIFRLELQVADMERNYYADHALTIARHPSETDERMMVRILAFALHANEALTFAQSIGSSEDEPDLWQRDLTGRIQLWVDVGLPDDKRIRRACGKSDRVVVYSYGRGFDLWWKQGRESLERSSNLEVNVLPQTATQALAKLADRNMKLNCTIQDGQVWLADRDESVQVEAERKLGGA